MQPFWLQIVADTAKTAYDTASPVVAPYVKQAVEIAEPLVKQGLSEVGRIRCSMCTLYICIYYVYYVYYIYG